MVFYCGKLQLTVLKIKEFYSSLKRKSMMFSMRFITCIVIGETPYPSIRTPDQLKNDLSSGVRMSRPENCCEVL